MRKPTIEFKFQPACQAQINEWMKDWVDIINKQVNSEDEWTEINDIPQYKFKNLKVVPDSNSELEEMNISLHYDEVKLIEN